MGMIELPKEGGGTIMLHASAIVAIHKPDYPHRPAEIEYCVGGSSQTVAVACGYDRAVREWKRAMGQED